MVKLILTLFFGGILLTFIGGFFKAYFHFKYIKLIYPHEFPDNTTFGSAFDLFSWNTRIQTLVFPYYKREKQLENDESTVVFNKLKLMTYLVVLGYFFFVLMFVIVLNN